MADSGNQGRSRVDELARLAETDPPALRAHPDELGTLLAADSGYVRARALRAAVALAETAPAAAVPLVDGLADCLDDDDLRADAALALGHVAAADASAVVPVVPALVAVVDDDDTIGPNATYAMQAVAAGAPDALAGEGVIRRLVGLLDDGSPAVRANAARALGDIAGADATAVCRGTDALGDRLADDHPAVRANAVHALGAAATACPDRIVELVPDIVGLRDDPVPAVRAATAFALGYPSRLSAADRAGAATALLAHVHHEDGAVRQHVTLALAEIASASPEAVEPGIEALTACLADDHVPVRRNAAGALATLRETFPEEVTAARAGLADRLETLDDRDDPAPFSLAGLRGLARDRDAPAELRTAARRAIGLVEAGEAPLDPDAGAPSVGASGPAPTDTGDAITTDLPADDGAAATFCPNCGETLDADGTVCPACGTDVD